MSCLPRTVAEAAGRTGRRDLIALTCGALTWALASRAQAMPTIGYLGSETPERYGSRLAAFLEGLAQTGHTEGRTMAIDFRWAEGDYTRLPALARELADRQVSVMVAPGGAEVALAAKAATETVPIVFEMGGDPIALGIVSSLSRPGGNLTGISSLSVEVSRKRLEFLSEVCPSHKSLAVAINPRSPTAASQLRNLQAAAERLGLRLVVLETSSEQEFDGMFAAVRDAQVGGLVFSSDPYFAYRSQQLAALAVRHGVPAMTQSRDFTLAGGLMSYGGDFSQSHRNAGLYAGRILKGEKPANLPVQRVTKVELFINLKAAHVLGLSFPSSLLSSADQIIE